MAIYHYAMKVIKRSAGRSSTAAAAYRAGLDITDERTGEFHGYANRGGVLDHAILTPSRAPDWAKEAGSLWNAVEEKENRKNSQLARENVVALPHELSFAQNRALLHGFVQEAYIKRGMAAQVDIHQHSAEGDERNIHAHIMLTMRGMSRNGWKEKKARNWNERETLQEWRALWAEHVNRALEQANVKDRVTEKSFKDLGLDKQPSKHLGPEATEMERRGENSRLGDENRAAHKGNRKHAELADQARKIAQEIEQEEAHAGYLAALEQRRDAGKKKGKVAEHNAYLSAQEERRKQAQEEAKRSAQKAWELNQREARNKNWHHERIERDRERARRGEMFEEQRKAQVEEIKRFYHLETLQEELEQARRAVEDSAGILGRVTGQKRKAKERETAARLNLENAAQRQEEAINTINRNYHYSPPDRHVRPERSEEAQRGLLRREYGKDEREELDTDAEKNAEQDHGGIGIER